VLGLSVVSLQNLVFFTTSSVIRDDTRSLVRLLYAYLGYGGDFCEDEIDDCLFVSCLNGTECQKDETNMSVGCPCPSGYIEVDSKCVDIDECASTYDGCHHTCRNTPGSYVCTCYEGFELAADGRTCEGE